jgi:hypothetical protein
MLELHTFKNGMVIMDGNRTVAKARPYAGVRGWALHIEGGCWLDERARRKKLSALPGGGIFDPSRMAVRTRREAEKILKSLILPLGQP